MTHLVGLIQPINDDQSVKNPEIHIYTPIVVIPIRAPAVTVELLSLFCRWVLLIYSCSFDLHLFFWFAWPGGADAACAGRILLCQEEWRRADLWEDGQGEKSDCTQLLFLSWMLRMRRCGNNDRGRKREQKSLSTDLWEDGQGEKSDCTQLASTTHQRRSCHSCPNKWNISSPRWQGNIAQQRATPVGDYKGTVPLFFLLKCT